MKPAVAQSADGQQKKDATPRSEETKDAKREHAAQHEPEVQRRLVYRKRKRTRLSVVRGKERHCARPVEALAAACRDGAKHHDSEERRGEAEPHRAKRPEDERTGDYALAVEAVAEKARDERDDGNRQEEDRVDVPKLALGEREIGLDIRYKHAEDRAVGLVEEVRTTQQRDDGPLVPAAHAIRLTRA